MTWAQSHWTEKAGKYYYNEKGNLLREDQVNAPDLEPGDRFFDVANGRWALLLRILPPKQAMGAPFEALYEGCDRFAPFVATAMHADIGDVVKLNA